MRAITVKELEQLLESQRGSSFVTILARTKPDFIGGKSSPLNGVEKSAKVNGVINWSYRNAVDNQRGREEQPLNAAGEVEWFEPEPRRWGVRLHNAVERLLPTVAKAKGPTRTIEELEAAKSRGETIKKYLELKVQRSLGYSFYRGNNRLETAEVLPHLRQKVEGRRQQVDNPVILRDYALDNIKAIRLHGELYVVQ